MGGDGEVGECSLVSGNRVGLGGFGGLCGLGGFALILSTALWICRFFICFLALMMASASGVSSLFRPENKDSVIQHFMLTAMTGCKN